MRLGLRIFLAAMLLGLAAGMAWAGGLYYWHFKVERVIRYMEDGGADAKLQPEMEAILGRAGCRALPNLVRASKPGRPAVFLNFTTGQIFSIVDRDEPVGGTADCDLRLKRRQEHRVELDDAEPARAAKLARLHQWWTAHGPELHQPWRFWSANCRGRE